MVPMSLIDLEVAAQRMARIVEGVPEDRLDDPTPCPAYTVGDLLDHLAGTAVAFAHAAAKTLPEGGSQPPSGNAERLADDWRAQIPKDLATLAEVWRDPAAWSGQTRVGGVDLPGEVAGVVALDELVIHAWDLARATGQEFDDDPASLEVVHGFVTGLAAPGSEQMRSGIFGPIVAVDPDAPLLDRTLGLAGRDPAWSPA
jgi:uncharacterized protein (TIGR03086 family)